MLKAMKWASEVLAMALLLPEPEWFIQLWADRLGRRKDEVSQQRLRALATAWGAEL